MSDTTPNNNLNNSNNTNKDPDFSGIVYYRAPAINPETPEQKAARGQLFYKLLGPTLIYALLFTFLIYDNPSGITMPVFSLTTVIYAFYGLKIFNKPVKKGSYLYAAAIVLLGTSSCLTDRDFFIYFNLIGILVMLVGMLLHNFQDDRKWTLSKHFVAFFTAIFGAIGSIPDPFSDGACYKASEKNTKNTKLMLVLLGVLIAIPLLIVLLALLSSADAVFGTAIAMILLKINVADIVGIIFTYVFAFMSAYCGLRYLGRGKISDTVKDNRKFDPIVSITVLSLISVIYMIFCGIQVVYLFVGGLKLPEGYTYASYVHEGFYQLLFVCIINLVIVLFTMGFFRKNTVNHLLLTLITICTYIMIASSAYRMILYIDAYGLSFLRITVLWFLLTLAVLFVGILIQIYKADFPLFRYGLVVVCSLYLVFSFSRPDYFIASYNLTHFTGHQRDLAYLTCSLTADAVPAFDKYGSSNLKDCAYRSYESSYFESIRCFNFSRHEANKLLDQ